MMNRLLKVNGGKARCDGCNKVDDDSELFLLMICLVTDLIPFGEGRARNNW